MKKFMFSASSMKEFAQAKGIKHIENFSVLYLGAAPNITYAIMPQVYMGEIEIQRYEVDIDVIAQWARVDVSENCIKETRYLSEFMPIDLFK